MNKQILNGFLAVLIPILTPELTASAGNAIDLNDYQSSFAGASATFNGFQSMHLVSSTSQVVMTDSKGNKLCSCGMAKGVAVVNCQERAATHYTAILTFTQVDADFPYMVMSGKSWLQEGDTKYSSADGTLVLLTLPLGEVDPNNLGVNAALASGNFSNNINRNIAQLFLTAAPGASLNLTRARMDIRVSDTDGSTHASVISGTVKELPPPPTLATGKGFSAFGI